MARKAARTRKVLKKDVAYCEGPGAGPSGSPLRTEGGFLETRLPLTSQPVPVLPNLLPFVPLLDSHPNPELSVCGAGSHFAALT